MRGLEGRAWPFRGQTPLARKLVAPSPPSQCPGSEHAESLILACFGVLSMDLSSSGPPIWALLPILGRAVLWSLVCCCVSSVVASSHISTGTQLMYRRTRLGTVNRRRTGTGRSHGTVLPLPAWRRRCRADTADGVGLQRFCRAARRFSATVSHIAWFWNGSGNDCSDLTTQRGELKSGSRTDRLGSLRG